jgi:hypothetical protein
MNRSALSALTESDIQNLRRALRFILKNSTAVEDVIQDAYVRVLAFFHRAARNVAIDQIRWRKRMARIYVTREISTRVGLSVGMIEKFVLRACRHATAIAPQKHAMAN